MQDGTTSSTGTIRKAKVSATIKFSKVGNAGWLIELSVSPPHCKISVTVGFP